MKTMPIVYFWSAIEQNLTKNKYRAQSPRLVTVCIYADGTTARLLITLIISQITANDLPMQS